MSEENKEPVEISFGIVGAADNSVAQIAFADGPRQIPAWVITELGGPGELEKIADNLNAVTFEDFMQGVHSVMTSRKLNNMQQAFVAQHFNPKFF